MIMTKNENLIRLKELTEKISKQNPNDEYKNILIELKKIMNEGQEKIQELNDSENKLTCYKNICSTINNFLNTLNFK